MARSRRVPMSHAQRQAAFLEVAAPSFDKLEAWYDEHPEASFGEIEAEARMDGSALPSMVRREMMGVGLEIIVNGSDSVAGPTDPERPIWFLTRRG